MAKYNEGDEVRLTKNMEFGNVKVRKTTKGEIKKIEKGILGKSKYTIRWQGLNFDITMTGESHIAPSGDLAWG